MLLSVIKGSELNSTLAGAYMSLENRGLSLTLGLSCPYLTKNTIQCIIQLYGIAREDGKPKGSQRVNTNQRGSYRSHGAIADTVNPESIGEVEKNITKKVRFGHRGITSHSYNGIGSPNVELNIPLVTTTPSPNCPSPLNTGVDAPECTFPW
jgi:hypothetical protein